jgi:hypothetical protein
MWEEYTYLIAGILFWVGLIFRTNLMNTDDFLDNQVPILTPAQAGYLLAGAASLAISGLVILLTALIHRVRSGPAPDNYQVVGITSLIILVAYITVYSWVGRFSIAPIMYLVDVVLVIGGCIGSALWVTFGSYFTRNSAKISFAISIALASHVAVLFIIFGPALVIGRALSLIYLTLCSFGFILSLAALIVQKRSRSRVEDDRVDIHEIEPLARKAL